MPRNFHSRRAGKETVTCSITLLLPDDVFSTLTEIAAKHPMVSRHHMARVAIQTGLEVLTETSRAEELLLAQQATRGGAARAHGGRS